MNKRKHNCLRPNLLLLVVGVFSVFTHPLSAQLFVEWNKTYGGLGWEEFQTVNLTDDGGYIFGGITTTREPSCDVTEFTRDTAVFPELTGDVWLVKTDGDGHIEWDRRYGGWDQDRMWSVSQTPDGGFIFGGESLSGEDTGTEHTEFNRGGYDYWLVKIDENGNHLWNRTYGGSEDDILRVVIPLENGGYILLGYSSSPSFAVAPGDKSEDSRGLADYWVVWLNENGNVVGDRTIGGDGDDWLNDAEMLPDGNILLAGWSTSGISGEKTEPNFGLNDYWVVKMDVTNGDIIWQKSFGGDGVDVPLDIFLTHNNEIILSGHSNSSMNTGNKDQPHFGLDDGWIIRLRDNGDDASMVWQKSLGGTSIDIAYAAAETSLGNLMLVGVSASPSDTITMVGNKHSQLIGANDFWINYLNPEGQKQWDFSMGGTSLETCVKIVPAHEYGFIFGGHSSSDAFEPFKSDDNCGTNGYDNDIFVIRTGCEVEPPILISDTITCEENFITLNATVDSCIFCQYLWSDGSTEPVRIMQLDSSLELGVSIHHPDGCKTESSVNIEVQPGIEKVSPTIFPIKCFQDDDAEIYIEAVEGGIAPYRFKLNDNYWDSLGYYPDLAPGNYKLEVVDSNGCTFDTTLNIEQPQEVLLELGEDIHLNYGDSIQLQALTNLWSAYTVDWRTSTELSCEDCLDPWTAPITSPTNIKVTVADSNGCTKEDYISIFVQKESSIYIPNSFSPNNDNINDFFTLYTDHSVREIKQLNIYNRKGELLFERKNFQPNIDFLGYDGRFRDKLLQPQVLVFWAELEYLDGSLQLQKGEINLMR